MSYCVQRPRKYEYHILHFNEPLISKSMKLSRHTWCVKGDLAHLNRGEKLSRNVNVNDMYWILGKSIHSQGEAQGQKPYTTASAFDHQNEAPDKYNTEYGLH